MKTFFEFSRIANLAIAARLRDDVRRVTSLTGLQQQQVARYCGIDLANFSRILNGKYVPSYSRVFWIVYVCRELCAEFYRDRK